MIEQVQLKLREHGRGSDLLLRVLDDGNPEDSTAKDETDCHQADVVAWARLLDATAGLEDLVEDLDLPTQIIVAELFHRLVWSSDRQIRQASTRCAHGFSLCRVPKHG